MTKLPEPLEQKRLAAIAWLRERGRYILDKDTPAPKWSVNKKKEKVVKLWDEK